MLMQILVFVSNRPEGVKSLMSGGLNLGDIEEVRGAKKGFQGRIRTGIRLGT